MDEEGYKWQLMRLVLPAPNGKTYTTLLNKLYSMNFIPKIERDENRATDGLMLREDFEWNGDRPCSVLEMIIALAGRFDGNSGFDEEHARYNFWIMVENLGIDIFDDGYVRKNPYSQLKIESIIQNFMNRNYRSDGFGGLFPLKKAKYDQRKIEIWDQMQEWLIEKYGI